MPEYLKIVLSLNSLDTDANISSINQQMSNRGAIYRRGLGGHAE